MQRTQSGGLLRADRYTIYTCIYNLTAIAKNSNKKKRKQPSRIGKIIQTDRINSRIGTADRAKAGSGGVRVGSNREGQVSVHGRK